ncbi:MAG: DUF502 domain-containing protein [bacterium]
MKIFDQISKDFKRIFVTGLLVILPVSITFALLSFVFTRIDRLFQPVVVNWIGLFMPEAHIEYIPGLGIVMTVAVILIIGLFVTNVIGMKLVELGEWILNKIPIVRSVYSASKQLMEAVTMGSNGGFNRVVMIEYPRKGIYSIAFVTSDAQGESQALTNEEVLNVFVPTTPNPTSGYLLLVPKTDIINLSITVEEGLKLVVSGGIVTPESWGGNGHKK